MHVRVGVHVRVHVSKHACILCVFMCAGLFAMGGRHAQHFAIAYNVHQFQPLLQLNTAFAGGHASDLGCNAMLTWQTGSNDALQQRLSH